MLPYCHSRYTPKRRRSIVANVGGVGIGGANPVRVQSMVNTDTLDIAATVNQTRLLAEAGCEIVRITAPTKKAARALAEIKAELKKDGVHVPLVADIHFTPQAALEAVEHVEKVRINPGNYADTKKFKVLEYTDADYALEIERIEEKFTPLLLRAQQLGRALRIGTNHGSLSDRIMNRYGDTPLGMVESALEFIRVCHRNGFSNLVLSMKASNPKVMVQAYRLAVAKLAEEGLPPYPLHLGVTEAGDGEDARIKSATGIGALLADGLGDTVRVSLTEDPVAEVPVATALAQTFKNMPLANSAESEQTGSAPHALTPPEDNMNPYEYTRRAAKIITLPSLTHAENAKGARMGTGEVPRVFVQLNNSHAASQTQQIEAIEAFNATTETPIEGIITPGGELLGAQAAGIQFINVTENETTWAAFLKGENFQTKAEAEAAMQTPASAGGNIMYTAGQPAPGLSTLATYRMLAATLKQQTVHAPVCIRLNLKTLGFNEHGSEDTSGSAPAYSELILRAATLAGSLLVDGIGDAVSVELFPEEPKRAAVLGYNILQGARARQSKTEYVACPSCGRTLFNLEETTQKIRAATGHLKSVTLAIMGCIVNGPGEMADADFGYVGGAPGKINLYVGKECVQVGIPETQAVEALIALIKKHGKWVDAPQ